jgi:hypothetical protein
MHASDDRRAPTTYNAPSRDKTELPYMQEWGALQTAREMLRMSPVPDAQEILTKSPEQDAQEIVTKPPEHGREPHSSSVLSCRLSGASTQHASPSSLHCVGEQHLFDKEYAIPSPQSADDSESDFDESEDEYEADFSNFVYGGRLEVAEPDSSWNLGKYLFGKPGPVLACQLPVCVYYPRERL